MTIDQKPKENFDIAPENHGPKFGKRHIQVTMAFLIVFLNYAQRISMSVIVVAMNDRNASINPNIPTYNWRDKGIITNAFLWGYMVPQVAAGYLATMFGAKWFLTASLFLSSFSEFFIPVVAATWGFTGVVILRMIQGLGQSCMFPSLHAFLSKWVPIQERSRLGTIPYMGNSAGTILSMVTAGVISSSWYGWPMALYIYGGVGVVAACLFGYLSASEPDHHSTISEEERAYIKNNLSQKGNTHDTKIPVPWIELFLSVPFWALIVVQIGNGWGNWMLLTETPIYMNKVMKFDIKSNSLLCSLPYLVETCLSMVYGVLADYLITRNILTIGKTRTLMNGLAVLVQAFFLIMLAQCDSDDAYLATTYLVLLGSTHGATRSGYNINHIDLSPNFSGILMGVSNGLTAAIASLGPVVVYCLVKNEENSNEWGMVFYISAAIAAGSYIFSAIFGSGSIQPWNEGSKKYRGKYQAVPQKA